jgi:hypothetical protein
MVIIDIGSKSCKSKRNDKRIETAYIQQLSHNGMCVHNISFDMSTSISMKPSSSKVATTTCS